MRTVIANGGDLEFEIVTWANNTDELLPNCPPPDMKLGLVPYPNGTTPSVVADKRDIFGVWAGPLYFFFLFYDIQIDVSEMMDKIYSVEVVVSDMKC
jgi:hypothetical protein